MSGDRRHEDRRHVLREAPEERRKEDRRHGERRQQHRMPMEIWMEEVFGEEVYFRCTGNIGAGGVFFDDAIPHPLGSTVTLKFVLPGDSEMVVARGEVVSACGTPEGLGMGVKFLSLEGTGHDRLSRFVTAP
ncbi:MAG TPA: PilZ domain-containing protein [Myxococcota bacterium]|nr:PilZ domain-containing protein [Myxococcota bacterium]